jgi:hypothetical protein
MRQKRKPLLCLDFDGVIHKYGNGWLGYEVVSDEPVPGSLEFLYDALEYFRVAIYSSRSSSVGGLAAMQEWLDRQCRKKWPPMDVWWDEIEWPTYKPSAFLTLDDRAMTFSGTFPSVETLLSFRTWYE